MGKKEKRIARRLIRLRLERQRMSYAGHIQNEELFDNLWNSKFYRLAAISELVNDLMGVDFSVVSSRREGHTSVMDFFRKGIVGNNVFNENLRFIRADRADTFVSDTDLNFHHVLISLANALSFRTSNQAKDTTAAVAGTGAAAKAESVAIAQDAGNQDASKRFEELVKRLKSYTRHSSATWTQTIFEARVATWH